MYLVFDMAQFSAKVLPFIPPALSVLSACCQGFRRVSDVWCRVSIISSAGPGPIQSLSPGEGEQRLLAPGAADNGH